MKRKSAHEPKAKVMSAADVWDDAQQIAKAISHNRQEETPEAKARWFQSLSLSERMDLLCFFTDLILESNPKIVELKDAQSTSGRVRVVSNT